MKMLHCRLKYLLSINDFEGCFKATIFSIAGPQPKNNINEKIPEKHIVILA